jgi:CRISPR/Cas system-associated exonuclease Cas4 (RecB family)
VRALIEGEIEKINEAELLDIGYMMEHHKPYCFSPSFFSTTSCEHAILIQGMYRNARKIALISSRLRRIFDNGNDVHTRTQRYAENLLYGSWECAQCRSIHNENEAFLSWARKYGGPDDKERSSRAVSASNRWIAKPKACHCGSDRFIYAEWHLIDEEHFIKGRTDGIIKLGKEFVGLELKSANSMTVASQKKSSTTEILDKWKRQLAVYLRLMGLKRGIILVENKDTQEYDLEYEVRVSDFKPFLDQKFKLLKKLKPIAESGILPDAPRKNANCTKCDFRRKLCNPK